MKKFLPAIIILVAAITLTACSPAVPPKNNNTTQETTAVQTTAATEKATEPQSITNENSDEKSESLTSKADNSTTKPVTTEETRTMPSSSAARPSTSAKAETTTAKAVTTTRTPETAPSYSIMLPQYSPQPEAVALFGEINNYRVKNGLNKLALDSELCKMAYLRAKEQNTLQGHNRPDGSKYYTILDEYGYNYFGCGENISFGKNVTVSSTFERWENSDLHNQNMLESRWTKAGIGMHRNVDGSYNIVILFAC